MRFLIVSEDKVWARELSDRAQAIGARATRASAQETLRALDHAYGADDAESETLSDALAADCAMVLLDEGASPRACEALASAGVVTVAFSRAEDIGGRDAFPCPVFPAQLSAPRLAFEIGREAARARRMGAENAEADPLAAAKRSLRRRAARLGRTIAEFKRRRRGIYKEMNLAVELQKSLLPKAYPSGVPASFTHRYIPMASVGGDFFDAVSLPGGRLGVFISDVSGHGIAPAFITAMIKSQFDYLHREDLPPAELLRAINREYSRIIDTDHFVTAFYCVFDFGRMRCAYSGAGHPPQLRLPRHGGSVALESSNPIIGMLPDFEYASAEVEIEPGDVFCFHTDGVIEARSADDRMFGRDGIETSLRATLEAEPESTLDSLADNLITDLIGYMKDPFFEDDITILLAKLTP